jgi:hypothetical protein
MKIIYILLIFVLSAFSTDLKEQPVQIKNTNEKEATIGIGNLQVGQSGIILNNDSQGKSVIICYGIILASDENKSVISFKFEDIIVQNAIPKTNLKPKDGDLFILNHLYKNSMILAPNFEAFSNAKKLYPNLNLLDSDFFAAYLKINNNPTPKKEDIIAFAHQNDLGRVFIITDKNLHTVDALSFTIVDSKSLTFDNTETNSPFYANIDEIKTSTFDFFGEESIGDYNKYYKKLLGITDGK